jgi:hypothetical protein
MIRDRTQNIEDSDPLTKGDRVENLGDWKYGLMEFTTKPNNDLVNRKKREQMKSREMDAFYPEI